MPTLRELTDAIRQHPGVRAVVILGDDGLVIETYDAGNDNAESLAAHVPAVASAARQLGIAANAGEAQLVLLELQHGYGVILRLSPQVMLFVSASSDVALANLLFDVRSHRTSMAALV